MNAFADGLTALFADPNIATSALWRAGGVGAGVAVRLVDAAPDESVGFGEARVLASARRVELLASAVPGLARGDTIEIDSVVHTVLAAPRRASDRLTVTVELGT